jgi:hypothetical protein
MTRRESIDDSILSRGTLLEDIANARGIAAVFFNGRNFDRAAVDEIPRNTAREAR